MARRFIKLEYKGSKVIDDYGRKSLVLEFNCELLCLFCNLHMIVSLLLIVSRS